MDNTVNSIGNIEDEKSHAIILVIDDVEASRVLLKRRLSIYGNEVIVCDSLQAAYTYLEKGNVDVIFLEIKIDNLNGLNILKQLKKDNRYVRIPVILMGTENETNLAIQSIEEGAEDFLIKPFNPSLLKARLINAIAKKKAFDRGGKYIAEMQEKQRQQMVNEKMTSLGDMASAISDELKNPLNMIINLAEVSAELAKEISNNIESIPGITTSSQWDTISNDSKNLITDMSKISKQGRKADKILRFMIDQSQFNKSDFYDADINKLISNAVKMFIEEYKMQHKKINAKIMLKLDNRIPRKMRLAAQAFGKAMFNLLENAVYFVNLKQTDEPKIIEITSRNNDDYVDIYIKDTGCGIEKNKLRMIFDPFFSTKADGEGQGLGLAAVSEVIVRMHKGRISVSSELNKYTQFKISIPKTIDK